MTILKIPLTVKNRLLTNTALEHLTKNYVGKRQNQSLTKLYGSANLPDAVEIFNFKTGGFRDLPIRLPEFISSGATSAQELEGIKTFTLLDRKEAVDFGLIEEETGVDYVPKYLRPNKGRY